MAVLVCSRLSHAWDRCRVCVLPLECLLPSIMGHYAHDSQASCFHSCAQQGPWETDCHATYCLKACGPAAAETAAGRPYSTAALLISRWEFPFRESVQNCRCHAQGACCRFTPGAGTGDLVAELVTRLGRLKNVTLNAI